MPPCWVVFVCLGGGVVSCVVLVPFVFLIAVPPPPPHPRPVPVGEQSMHSLAASLSADDFEMIGMAGGSGGNVPDATALAGLGRDLWGGIDGSCPVVWLVSSC